MSHFQNANFLEVKQLQGKKESSEKDTHVDRHRYLARRIRNESRKSRIMQESDLSKIAKTEASLFTILGQFGSPQVSIRQKIGTCLGFGNLLDLTSTVQKKVKRMYR